MAAVEAGPQDGPHPCWEFLECQGEVPQSRSGHTCALYQNRYFYIFGGFDGTHCFDDLYVLDLEQREWRRIFAAGDCPSGRASHSAVTDELAGVMYIFGGSGSHFGYTNKRDLCEFCFETETWRLLSNPHEDTPSARYGQSMVAYQEGLYVWGGTHGTNYPTDMHRFDLCSKQWESVVTSGDQPCGRYRHQAMVKDDTMYIVGGSGVNRYGDVFTFNFTTSIWRKLVCTGTDLSDGRYAHSAVLRDGYIFLYGGNDGARHDDLQQLDLETKVWSRVVVHGACPPGRDFHAAVLRRDSMVIFGGSNGSRRHNDVFEFHMGPKIPPPTLSSDLEELLAKAQCDVPTQRSCDLFLAADSGQSGHGMYCHSHLLAVRCPRLYELVKERLLPPDAAQPSEPANQDAHMAVEKWSQDGHSDMISTPRGAGAEAAAMDVSDGLGCAAKVPQRPVWPHASQLHCSWAPLEMSLDVLQYLLHFLYADTTKFGRIQPEHLYRLFLAAKHLEVPRLAALCERQLKVKLAINNVLPLLRASTADGPAAQPIQDACKFFFLANFEPCMELREAEDLGQKLLCELVRMHNARSSTMSQMMHGTRLLPDSPVSTTVPMTGTRLLPGPTVSTVRIPPGTLAEDLKRLWVEQIVPDFKVKVQGEVILAHRFLLVARSRYFSSCILTSGMVEAQANLLDIPEEAHITADAFRTFLLYLYAEDDILSHLAHNALYLVEASAFYGLANLRLKHFCEASVKESFNEEQILYLFEGATRMGAEGVRQMALEFILKNFQGVCRQPAMEQLDKPLLIDIIKGLAERMPVAPSQGYQSTVPQCLG